MAGFQVQIAALRKTGTVAAHAAGEVQAVHIEDALPQGTIGMPGSGAVTKLAALRGAYGAQEAGFARRLSEHGDSISQAVKLYQDHEDAARADLAGLTVAAPPAGGRAANGRAII